MRSILILLLLSLAFSLQAKRFYVSPEGDDSNDGSDWSAAFLSLHHALCTSGDNDEIWMAEGKYTSKYNDSCMLISGQAEATFYINKSIMIYGGFKIGATSLNQQDPENNPTILTGGPSDHSDNSLHVILIEGGEEITISGLIIRDGFADGASDRGGGIKAISTGVDMSLIIANCYFTNNKSTNNGGAVHLGPVSSDMCAVIDACIFDDNESSGSGGALSTIAITNNLNLYVINTIFSNNFGDASAGAISGGTTSGGESFLDFVHCTFVKNKADLFGSVMRLVPASNGGNITARLFQCVSAWNVASNSTYRGSPGVSYEFYNCAIQEESSCASIGTNGSITCSGDMLYGLDPQFVDTLSSDYRLRASSPVIKLGEEIEYNNCLLDTTIVKNDITGFVRDSPYDYGAYEYQCIDNLTLSGELASGAYVVSNDIISNGKVCDSTLLNVGNTVVLDLEFEVKDNASFEVQIGGCN